MRPAREERDRPSARAQVARPAPPPAILAALVGALLPARPALPSAERAAVEAEVAETVAVQLGAMPAFLRLPVRAALLAFDLLPLARWGRTFRTLDAARRTAWIRAWDEGGVGPMRALVKLVRSCALFAWFDHPRVTAALGAGSAG